MKDAMTQEEQDMFVVISSISQFDRFIDGKVQGVRRNTRNDRC